MYGTVDGLPSFGVKECFVEVNLLLLLDRLCCLWEKYNYVVMLSGRNCNLVANTMGRSAAKHVLSYSVKLIGVVVKPAF